jgi:hypothetical protein
MKELKKIYQEYVDFSKMIINGTAPQGMKDMILKLLWLELEKTSAAPVKRKGRPPLSRKEVKNPPLGRKKFTEILKESKKAKEVEEKV